MWGLLNSPQLLLPILLNSCGASSALAMMGLAQSLQIYSSPIGRYNVQAKWLLSLAGNCLDTVTSWGIVTKYSTSEHYLWIRDTSLYSTASCFPMVAYIERFHCSQLFLNVAKFPLFRLLELSIFEVSVASMSYWNCDCIIPANITPHCYPQVTKHRGKRPQGTALSSQLN